MVEILTLQTEQMGNNVYLIANTDNKEAFIVDPSFSTEEIEAFIDSSSYKLKGIVLTHGHFDHIFSVESLKGKYDIPLYAGENEVDLLKEPTLNLSTKIRKEISLQADYLLKDNEVLELAGIKVLIIATPGHTAGSICLYIEEAKALVTGDTLFAGSYGRTDFVGGDFEFLKSSILDKLFSLPDDTIVYPGHDNQSELGYEKKYNPIAR